jgi:hypothetical protein
MVICREYCHRDGPEGSVVGKYGIPTRNPCPIRHSPFAPRLIPNSRYKTSPNALPGFPRPASVAMPP